MLCASGLIFIVVSPMYLLSSSIFLSNKELVNRFCQSIVGVHLTPVQPQISRLCEQDEEINVNSQKKWVAKRHVYHMKWFTPKHKQLVWSFYVYIILNTRIPVCDFSTNHLFEQIWYVHFPTGYRVEGQGGGRDLCLSSDLTKFVQLLFELRCFWRWFWSN